MEDIKMRSPAMQGILDRTPENVKTFMILYADALVKSHGIISYEEIIEIRRSVYGNDDDEVKEYDNNVINYPDESL